jgi:hypothetical protein
VVPVEHINSNPMNLDWARLRAGYPVHSSIIKLNQVTHATTNK